MANETEKPFTKLQPHPSAAYPNCPTGQGQQRSSLGWVGAASNSHTLHRHQIQLDQPRKPRVHKDLSEFQSPTMQTSQRGESDFCVLYSRCVYSKLPFVFYFIASVTTNVGHLQRWKPAASSVNQSLQQRDKEIITNSLSRKIIVATL